MRASVDPTATSQESATAFIAELDRLQDEVRAVERQIERVEAELRRVLHELARERYWEYR